MSCYLFLWIEDEPRTCDIDHNVRYPYGRIPFGVAMLFTKPWAIEIRKLKPNKEKKINE
jgi:hypothetical protein